MDVNSSKPIRTILAALIVVAFGWGAGYVVLQGIGVLSPSTVIIKTENRTATVDVAKTNEPENTASIGSKISSFFKNDDRLLIAMGGDVMFDRYIRNYGENNGYNSLFDNSIISLFKKADIAVANLENPITENLSKTLVDGKGVESFIFTGSLKGVDALANAGIDMVSLANNHTDNFGLSGFLETQKWLNQASIAWFGNPWNSTSSKMSTTDLENDDSPIVTIVDKNGFKVAFVGYHSFQLGIDRVISEIKRVSGTDTFTIVMPHWGEEYTYQASDRLKSQARAFIAAGADAVIGAHPHVIMENEWVGNVPVFYSLGNLLFDQYFSPEVMKGNVVELHLTKDGLEPHLERLEMHTTKLVKSQGVTLDD